MSASYVFVRVSSDFSVRGRIFEKKAFLETRAAFPGNGVTASSTNPGNRAHAFRITVVDKH